MISHLHYTKSSFHVLSVTIELSLQILMSVNQILMDVNTTVPISLGASPAADRMVIYWIAICLPAPVRDGFPQPEQKGRRKL